MAVRFDGDTEMRNEFVRVDFDFAAIRQVLAALALSLVITLVPSHGQAAGTPTPPAPSAKPSPDAQDPGTVAEVDRSPLDASTPASLIDGLHAALLSIMKDAEPLGFTGRRDRLRPILAQAFDLPAMAQIAVGRAWPDMNPAQQDGLIEAFSQITFSTYADRFDGFSGERFETLGEQPAPQGRTWVKTQIIRGNGEPVAINYLVTPAGQQWKIVDVYLTGGISEMATRRAEYTSVIKREGLEGLIAALNAKVAEMEKRT